VRQEQLERLVHDAAAAGGGLQPVAQLGVTVAARPAQPGQLHVAERAVGAAVGDAPVQVLRGVHRGALLRQPGREPGRGGLGAGRHEPAAGLVRLLRRPRGVVVAPGTQPHLGPLEHGGDERPDASGLPVGRGEQLVQRRVGGGPVVVGHHRVLGADAGEPGPPQRSGGGDVVDVGARLQPVQTQPPVRGVGEGVPDQQLEGLAHGATAAALGVEPVADHGAAGGERLRQPEAVDVAERSVGPDVGDAPPDGLALRGPAALGGEPGAEGLPGQDEPAEEPAARLVRHRVGGRRVVLPPGAQAHPLSLEHRHVEPAVQRLHRVALEQGAGPRVVPAAVVGQQLPHGALNAEAEPPRRTARGPVADVRPPVHDLDAVPVERVGDRQAGRPAHQPLPTHGRVQPEPELGRAGAVRAVVEAAGEARPAGQRVEHLHRPHPVAALGPPPGGRADERARLLRSVGLGR
jgi:hypothetical protein